MPRTSTKAPWSGRPWLASHLPTRESRSMRVMRVPSRSPSFSGPCWPRENGSRTDCPTNAAGAVVEKKSWSMSPGSGTRFPPLEVDRKDRPLVVVDDGAHMAVEDAPHLGDRLRPRDALVAAHRVHDVAHVVERAPELGGAARAHARHKAHELDGQVVAHDLDHVHVVAARGGGAASSRAPMTPSGAACRRTAARR